MSELIAPSQAAKDPQEEVISNLTETAKSMAQTVEKEASQAKKRLNEKLAKNLDSLLILKQHSGA